MQGIDRREFKRMAIAIWERGEVVEVLSTLLENIPRDLLLVLRVKYVNHETFLTILSSLFLPCLLLSFSFSLYLLFASEQYKYLSMLHLLEWCVFYPGSHFALFCSVI